MPSLKPESEKYYFFLGAHPSQSQPQKTVQKDTLTVGIKSYWDALKN